MNRLQLLIAAALAVLTLPVLAQKKACDLVTQSEAAAIVGSAVEMQALPTSCVFKVKGSTVALHVRISKSNSATVDSTKASFGKSGATVKDEPSLGASSYSAVWPNADRIYVLKGEQMVRIDYVNTGSKIPDSMMDKLRAAAKTALGRL